MFDHLDDPSPRPAPPTGLIAARGLAIRTRRRRVALGGAAVTTAAVLVAALTLTGGSRVDSLQTADDPTPTTTAATAEPTPTPLASATVTPSATPTTEPTATSTTAAAVLPPYQPDVLLPGRTPQPSLTTCTAAQSAQAHPTGVTAPAGLEVVASITAGTVRATERGANWSVKLSVRNSGPDPVTFDYRAVDSGVYAGGRQVGGLPEGAVRTTEPGSKTVGPGQTLVLEQSSIVSTWSCSSPSRSQLEPLPYGRYELSVGVRTGSGTWYADSLPGWVGPMDASGCFADSTADVPAPTDGLTLSVVGVPDHVADPDSSFTAQLRVTNTTSASVDFTAQDPGRLVTYLSRSGKVGGGWSSGSSLPAKTYSLAAGASRTFDVEVRGESCSAGQPMSFGPWQVVAGIATVRDGQTYLWTARGARVTYPG
jgi:hypothetical protein